MDERKIEFIQNLNCYQASLFIKALNATQDEDTTGEDIQIMVNEIGCINLLMNELLDPEVNDFMACEEFMNKNLDSDIFELIYDFIKEVFFGPTLLNVYSEYVKVCIRGDEMPKSLEDFYKDEFQEVIECYRTMDEEFDEVGQLKNNCKVVLTQDNNEIICNMVYGDNAPTLDNILMLAKEHKLKGLIDVGWEIIKDCECIDKGSMKVKVAGDLITQIS